MYRVVPDAASLEQVAALPVEALSAYAEVLAVLELQPWNGRPNTRTTLVRRCGTGASDLIGRVRSCT